MRYLCGAFQCLLIYHLLDYLLINPTFDRSSFWMLRHGFQGSIGTCFLLWVYIDICKKSKTQVW